MKQTFTRGRFARLNGVSLFTLRLYDRMDILKPAFTDANGYHLYTDDQSQQLLFIDLCIKSGFSLKEIRTLQSEIRTPEELLELLRSIRMRIHRKRVEYDSCERMIDSLIYYHETSSEQEPDRPFVKGRLHYHGLVSGRANFFLPENAELSHMFIRQAEERLGHPIEFPLSYLVDPREPDFSRMRLILRTREALSGEDFYDSGSCELNYIQSFRSDVTGLREKLLEFLHIMEKDYEPQGEILLTPVQDYMFHREGERSVYVAGIPVRPRRRQPDGWEMY